MDIGLYRLLLELMHIIYTVYTYTRRLTVKLKSQLEEVFFGRKSIKADLDYVSRELTRMKKVPSHLVLIFGPEGLSIKDIVNITLWSQAAGIAFVSFYDFKGHIKKYKPIFDDALVRAHNNKHHIPKKNGYKNGTSSKATPVVRFLDITDGKQVIIQVTRNLAEEALAGKLHASNISIDSLHTSILKESGIPEPDLALYCGEICSSYGFSPWHLRVTEFLPLNSHHNVRVETFVSLLRRYGCCEQRLGT